MLGHEVQLSETNLRGWVPICECGWVGHVAPATAIKGRKGKRVEYRTEVAKGIATVEHGAHLDEVREAIAKEHARALDTHAATITVARRSLHRVGRWGNG